MCGVFGYVGQRRDVGATVGTALKRLEYRGYDSWGMAWAENQTMRTAKDVGRINGTAPRDAYSGIGIGHTRWATHGRVTTANAHPHLDCIGRIAVVHNGIIENIDALRASLSSTHRVVSETDSEVVAHLIEEEMANHGASLAGAIREVFPRLEGFNAIVAIDAQTSTMVATKRTSPLLVGQNDDAFFVASDALAFAGLATWAATIEDGTVVQLDGGGMRVSESTGGESRSLNLAKLAPADAGIDDAADQPGAFMRREIDEQPRVIAAIAADVGPVRTLADMARRASSIMIVGCGSALNAAEYGRYLLAGSGINAIVIPASEIHYAAPLITPSTLVIAVSQSGETADVIDAVHLARERNAMTAAIVNVLHATLARTVDHCVPLLAGTERSVLATKSFTAMLARFIQVAACLAGDTTAAVKSLTDGVTAMQGALAGPRRAEVEHVSEVLADREHVFVLGRGRTWPIARETALKIQEGTYIHAQAFPGGELKHGPLALITDGTPCLVLPGEGQGARQLRSNASEVRSRGGRLISIGADRRDIADDALDTAMEGPAGGLVETAIVQQIALHAALRREINPDRPRNLAKSVTVK